MKYKCCVPDWDDHDCGSDGDEVEGRDAEDAAEEYAKYIYDHRDGWEGMPKNTVFIEVMSPDGTVTGFNVFTEFAPSFHIEEADNG